MLGQISLFTILLLGVSTVRSQVIPCHDLKVVDNLNIDKFMGKWHMQYIHVNAYGEGLTCLNINYSNNGNGTVAVSINGVRNNKPTNLKGTAKIIKSGEFSVSYSSLKVENQSRYVLYVDYDKFSVMSSCDNIWVVTREIQPSQEVINAALQVLKDNNLSTISLIKVDQNGCSN